MASKTRRCIFCSKSVAKYSYSTHLLSHICEKPVFCKFCSVEFSTSQSLRLHIHIHHPAQAEKRFKCSFCPRYFPEMGQLNKHLGSHTGEMPFRCQICQKRFLSKDGLREHVKRHSNERIYQCEYCVKSFYTLSNLKTHIEYVHLRSKLFPCPMCPTKCHSANILRRHIKTHTGEKAFKCNICDRSFVTAAGVKQHRISAHSESGHKISCTLCNMKFNPWHLKVHMATHSKPYECSICGKHFAVRNRMQKHQKEHATRGLLKHECNVCKKGFDTESGRRIHEKSHTNLFPCQTCGKTFKHKCNLTMHLRRHNKERRLKCAFCDHAYVDLSALKGHLLQHIGEKPWICYTCGLETRTSHALKSHSRRHATVKISLPKVFECSICQMKFAWRGNWMRHLRFHTGEKPYDCKFCGKRYAKKLTLTVHIQKHHPCEKNG